MQRPGLQAVIGYTGGVQDRTADDTPHVDILGEAHNIGPDREVLWRPFNGENRGEAGRPAVPHHIKYGGGRSHPTLG